MGVAFWFDVVPMLLLLLSFSFGLCIAVADAMAVLILWKLHHRHPGGWGAGDG